MVGLLTGAQSTHAEGASLGLVGVPRPRQTVVRPSVSDKSDAPTHGHPEETISH